MTYYFILNVLGLTAFFLLFYRFPMLSSIPFAKTTRTDKISVVIPMRNEQHNIGKLLRDLNRQKHSPYEVICVDDLSTDKTAEIVSEYQNVKLLKVGENETNMNTKAYACQLGAQAATGDMLLFLDADVRLSADALSKLLESSYKEDCTITVQPYHNILKPYERCSLFFNLVQLAGNGSCSAFKSKAAGLFGPVIFIKSDLYKQIGGHSCVQNSVVDDLKLGQCLTQRQERFSVRLGGDTISFRMYPQGIRELSQGWVKNIAIGAGYTSSILFVLTFLWLTGCAASISFGYKLHEGINNNMLSQQSIMVYGLVMLIIYMSWVICIATTSEKIGRFGFGAALLYPIWLLYFFWMFSISLFKRVFRLSVVWKGRKIKNQR